MNLPQAGRTECLGRTADLVRVELAACAKGKIVSKQITHSPFSGIEPVEIDFAEPKKTEIPEPSDRVSRRRRPGVANLPRGSRCRPSQRSG